MIQAGEPIVLDIGGTLGGYGSDITRTLWVTGGDPANGPDEEFRHLFARPPRGPGDGDAGRPARASPARRSTRPPATSSPPRATARRSSTGPATASGSRATRSPYLVAGNGEPLGEGMAFSVEPGIYLAGRYGARIEDIVVCGGDGPIPLNETDRELRVVAG